MCDTPEAEINRDMREENWDSEIVEPPRDEKTALLIGYREVLYDVGLEFKRKIPEYVQG